MSKIKEFIVDCPIHGSKHQVSNVCTICDKECEILMLIVKCGDCGRLYSISIDEFINRHGNE